MIQTVDKKVDELSKLKTELKSELESLKEHVVNKPPQANRAEATNRL